MNTVKLPFYARLALILLAVGLILVFMMQGRNILIPLVFAMLISILLHPLNKFFENKLHLGRSLSAFLCLLIFIGCITGFIYFLSVQLVNFSEDLPQLEKKLSLIFANVQHWIWREFHVNSKQQTDYITKSTTVLSTAASSITNIFASFATIILWTIFIFIYTFFMLYHRRLLVRFILHLFAEDQRPKVQDVVTETRGMINSYVLGLLTEMLILSIVCSSMFLIMGIKFALLLGVMTGVLNIIPYLGIYTSAAIAMLITFANNGSNGALEVAIGLAAVHLIDSNVIMPRIVGSRVKMNPFITIIAVIVGEFIWGIPGMFLFIPIMGIIKLICEHVDGLEAWAILIGTEDKPKPQKLPKAKIPKE